MRAARDERDAVRLRGARQADRAAEASEAGSITLIVALCRFVTQIRPFGATAIERGATPTPISPSLAWVTASNTVTESLSWFTTHSLALPVARGSNASVEDAVGRTAASGR